MTLCFVVLDPRRIAIFKLVPPLFLGHPFGFARMEVVLYSDRSSGTEFIGWPNALSSQLYIRSVCILRSYHKLLFVQYVIMCQLEDQGLFSLRHVLSSWAHPLDLAMTLGLTSVCLYSP